MTLRYRRPSLKTMLGITRLKKRCSTASGLTALKRPFRAPGNFERRIKGRVGYYSGPMKFIRYLMHRPG
jgi:hypothetical protein